MADRKKYLTHEVSLGSPDNSRDELVAHSGSGQRLAKANAQGELLCILVVGADSSFLIGCRRDRVRYA
jgi:hypothetical protein